MFALSLLINIKKNMSMAWPDSQIYLNLQYKYKIASEAEVAA